MLRDDSRAAPAARAEAGEALDDNGCTRAEAAAWRAQHSMLWGLIEDAVRAAPNATEAARRAALLRYELLELHKQLTTLG